ncbi:metal-sensitive transcriptional regulator [Streptomyces sp. NPDC059982]|uniref:metal-sensitive transcriptional regulator n=1 Tax=unclassified Streptomyces TaxID=2593676 RepID=UPI00368646C5
MAGYPDRKEDVRRALRQIEAQVRGVQRMVAEDVACVDVLARMSAVGSALRSCAVTLLDAHLDSCVTEAIAEGGEAAKARVGEATLAIARLIRT